MSVCRSVRVSDEITLKAWLSGICSLSRPLYVLYLPPASPRRCLIPRFRSGSRCNRGRKVRDGGTRASRAVALPRRRPRPARHQAAGYTGPFIPVRVTNTTIMH